MEEQDPTRLPEIVALLSTALELADDAEEFLLGALIDEALQCAQSISSVGG